MAGTTRSARAMALLLGLAGCVTLPEGVTPLLQRNTDAGPEASARCTASDVTPAVIETVTEDILLQPAQIGADGAIIEAAVFETRTRQKIVQERREVTFETPCPPVFDAAFVASLQRALKARGYYTGEINALMDDETGQAIRRYQAQFGLNSAILSSETARRLGLLVTETRP